MRTWLVVVVAVSGCGKKADAPAPAPATGGCPQPSDGIVKRFAVGVEPDYGLPDMRADHGSLCHDTFTANNVVKMDGEHPKLVAEGTFTGSCKESVGPRTYEAVAPAKAVVYVDSALHEGGLGVGKPAQLELAQPDKMIALSARVVDKCGTELDIGATRGTAKWTAAPSCDKVAKLVPFSPGGPLEDSIQVAAVGAGNCTVNVAMLGVTGEVAVIVK